jgi:hypothetical protein
VHLVVAQDVADVLAQEALDALAEFLHAVDVGLAHAPRAVGASGFLGLNFLMRFLTSKFHDTSLTRSLTRGNARIGTTLTGLSCGSSLSRVMHMSRGTPLISAEHEPALPRLAVPAHRQVVRLLGLDPWNRVEHDHAGLDRGLVVDQSAGLAVAAPDAERDLAAVLGERLGRAHFCSSMTC